MRILELFSGTGSVGKVFKQNGWDVLSVDMNMDADIQCDILNFNFMDYGDFDFIWASPPCRYYSRLSKPDECLMTMSDELVLKTLHIIYTLKPKHWCIENPQTGRLKTRLVVKGLKYYDVDYCKYSNWGYKKATRLWTNISNFKPKICRKDCDNLNADGNHISKGGKTLYDRYRIPPSLIQDIIDCIE